MSVAETQALRAGLQTQFVAASRLTAPAASTCVRGTRAALHVRVRLNPVCLLDSYLDGGAFGNCPLVVMAVRHAIEMEMQRQPIVCRAIPAVLGTLSRMMCAVRRCFIRQNFWAWLLKPPESRWLLF